MQARFLSQLGKTRQRVHGAPPLQRGLRLEHQPWDGETRRLRFGARKRHFDGIEIARLQRRSRGDQRAHRRRTRNRERFLRKLARLTVAALDQRHDGGVFLRARAADLSLPAMLANVARQSRQARDDAHECV